MSQPEWMQKFKEIGQKGEEEVTGMEDGGFVKSGGAQGEDDAAALFYGAGVKSRDSTDPPGEAKNSDDESSEAANSEAAIDDIPENETLTSGMPSTTTGYSSGMPSTTTNSSSDLPSSTTSGLPSITAGSSTGIHSSTTASKDDTMGESWVQNRDSDINSTAAVEAARASFQPGESFVTEEVLVDEDGNEIAVDENGNEIPVPVEEEAEEEAEEEVEEEEILVDEDGNELEPEPQPVSYTNSRAAEYSAEFYNDEEQIPPPEMAPVYDIEQQKQILRGEGKKSSRSRMSWCIPLLVFAMILAAVLLVIFFVVYNPNEDRSVYEQPPTMAPTKSLYQQIGNDAASTTVFGRLRNDCSFRDSQPNFLDQCKCKGSVDILAEDVRERWESYVKFFIPSIYPEWSYSIDSCSAENQALLWLSSGINNGGEISYLMRLQRYILAIVFFQQGGVKWTRTANWVSEKNVCEWEGVECTLDPFVRILNLDDNNLTGELSDAPAKLNAIEAYYASNNDMNGSLPSAYFNSPTLRYIDFSGNGLTGKFPSDILVDTKLFAVNVASNSLDGTLPKQIKKIEGLQILNIESNGFSGKLPSSLYSLPLTELSIGGNQFTGTVPGSLPDVSTLTSISLGPNLFTGDIPTNLSELTGLKKLSMVGIPLTGRLPTSYALNLTDLVELSIADTSVGGDIPFQYTTMASLETLNLSNNDIRGNILKGFGLMTNLKSLSLAGNVLTGMIPTELGLLTSIEELQLGGNEIYGTIPDEFVNLSKIKTLTFDGTFMDGRMPEGICDLRDADLTKLVVDCPTLVGASAVDGIICSVPACCTECV